MNTIIFFTIMTLNCWPLFYKITTLPFWRGPVCLSDTRKPGASPALFRLASDYHRDVGLSPIWVRLRCPDFVQVSLTSVDWPLLHMGRRSLGSAFWISIPLVTHENIKTADDCLMVYVRVSQILGRLIRRKNQESNLYLSGDINGGMRCFGWSHGDWPHCKSFHIRILDNLTQKLFCAVLLWAVRIMDKCDKHLNNQTF